MQISEYRELIPYFCTFPHIRTFRGAGDVCWGITNNYITRFGYCDHCDCAGWAERKYKFWSTRMFNDDRSVVTNPGMRW